MKYAKKRLSRPVIISALMILIALVGISSGVLRVLPMRSSDRLLARDIPEYEGVITIWLAESFLPGSGSYVRWIINSVGVFERTHPGIFIHLRPVEPSVAAEVISKGDELPDAIICPGGVVKSPKWLIEMESSPLIIPAFTEALTYDEKILGVPISAGAYTILYNQARLLIAGTSGLYDQTDYESLFAPPQTKPRRVPVSYALSGGKTEYQAFSLALCDMLSIPSDAYPYIAPDLFQTEPKKAWADFVLDLKSAAFAATQKEVARIKQLENGGNAFPWTTSSEPCRFTDQLLSMYFFDKPGENAEIIVEALCDFAEILLSHERQQALADIGAFSVLKLAMPLYPETHVMHYMEKGLNDPELRVPNMFTLGALHKEVAIIERIPDVMERLKEINALLDKPEIFR